MEMAPAGAADRGGPTPVYDKLVHLTETER
jgi:hypothetical protein